MSLTCQVHLSKNTTNDDSYFVLMHGKDVITSIGMFDHSNSPLKETATSSAGFSGGSIHNGIDGLILALLHNHTITKDHPVFALIAKNKNGSFITANSFPLFFPICGWCCGFEDLGIERIDHIVKITNRENKQWDVSLEEYMEMVLTCVNEVILRSRDNQQTYSESFWKTWWLCRKVGFEGPEDVKKIFLPRLYSLAEKYCIGID